MLPSCQASSLCNFPATATTMAGWPSPNAAPQPRPSLARRTQLPRPRSVALQLRSLTALLRPWLRSAAPAFQHAIFATLSTRPLAAYVFFSATLYPRVQATRSAPRLCVLSLIPRRQHKPSRPRSHPSRLVSSMRASARIPKVPRRVLPHQTFRKGSGGPTKVLGRDRPGQVSNSGQPTALPRLSSHTDSSR